MNRDLLEKLQDWNRNERRKPLVLMGARQVGKTWLMEEFSRVCHPEDTVKVNFASSAKSGTGVETGKGEPAS